MPWRGPAGGSRPAMKLRLQDLGRSSPYERRSSPQVPFPCSASLQPCGRSAPPLQLRRSSRSSPVFLRLRSRISFTTSSSFMVCSHAANGPWYSFSAALRAAMASALLGKRPRYIYFLSAMIYAYHLPSLLCQATPVTPLLLLGRKPTFCLFCACVASRKFISVPSALFRFLWSI